jgi:hypothetical protein
MPGIQDLHSVASGWGQADGGRRWDLGQANVGRTGVRVPTRGRLVTTGLSDGQ